MRQSAAAASPRLFEFAVLFISFCLRPLLPTRKLQRETNSFQENRVYLGVKTCEVFLCFVTIMLVLSFTSLPLCFLCSTSLVKVIGFCTEDEPENRTKCLFPLGSFESNILWNPTCFRACRLGTFIPGSWRIATRITSLQLFLFGALTRKKIPLLTALPSSSIKIIRDLRKPHAAFVCLHAFVIAAFQLFNVCH